MCFPVIPSLDVVCRREMKCCLPILLAVPQGALTFWEGEWAFWAGDDADLLLWAGSNATRAALVEHELWLAPCSLDSRSCLRPRDHLPSRVFPLPGCLCAHGQTWHLHKLCVAAAARHTQPAATRSFRLCSRHGC